MSNRRPSNETTRPPAGNGTALPAPPAVALRPAQNAPRRASRSAMERVKADEPRKARSVLKLLNTMLTVLVATMVALAGATYYVLSSLDVAGPLEQNRIVAIPRNDGSLAIAERLEREGVVSSRHMFLLSYWLVARQSAWAGGKPVQLKAGEYELKQQASLRTVIDTLAEGRTVLMRVTIPEGLTSHQIAERIKADQSLTGDLKDVPPEGTLLPETYSLPRGSSRQAVVDMMQSSQRRVLEQLWAERQEGLPLKSPQEALILASIVEKETGRNDERDRVAAVFVNRLRQNMKLQSDPTILYGLAQGRVQWGKPILRSEIQSNTAHNTYVIPGLPPTPICNPGRAAIEAVLKPAQTKELFFVADGKGGHVFAETLKDHNANVAKWREIEKNIQQQRAAGAAATLAPATTINAKGAAPATPPAKPATPPKAVAPAAAATAPPPAPSQQPVAQPKPQKAPSQ